ncbi:MAG TPA: holo-ACP synthase [Bacillus bacterium]|uniref:Holo-[acyl-carrier-protein] synthase n=1 Tax=Siminovitchia fordii TaxID=254759 RepID=A0ABQ4K8Y1_9BACI|nr:holo-ACP synthase [Siminovitchia fordii]GIN22167.1 holo-[acyl-carrier-protein] synthase [Siminovitchia fordii]HBZ09917.1 holo-ACP synthase [Bacillus sp. (in: firmicutes)]
MILGIGLDLVEIERIEKVIGRHARFCERVLSGKELHHYETLPEKRKVEFLAGRFAAKEAYAKALGTGIGRQLSFQDIEISPDESGKPHIIRPVDQGKRIHLSITHTKAYAAAQVVIEEN